MTTTTFTDLITAESQLRDIFGWPSARAVNKQIDHLDQHCRAIIAKSPFLLLGTSDPTGRCDVSPKGANLAKTSFPSVRKYPTVFRTRGLPRNKLGRDGRPTAHHL